MIVIKEEWKKEENINKDGDRKKIDNHFLDRNIWTY